MDTAPPDLVPLGAVRGAYGVKGWARIEPFGPADTLLAVRDWWLQGADGSVRRLGSTGARRHGAAVLGKWEGCESPEAAEQLKGSTVAVARSQFPPLPPGEFYWVDLIGARVINRRGLVLGTVKALASNGVQDLLQVEAAGAADGAGPVILVPLVERYVDAVDLDAHEVRVDWETDW